MFLTMKVKEDAAESERDEKNPAHESEKGGPINPRPFKIIHVRGPLKEVCILIPTT